MANPLVIASGNKIMQIYEDRVDRPPTLRTGRHRIGGAPFVLRSLGARETLSDSENYREVFSQLRSHLRKIAA